MRQFAQRATISLAVAGMIAMSGAAQAADIYNPQHGGYKDEPVYAPAAISWTGFYIGGNAGYSWGSTDWDFPNKDKGGSLAKQSIDFDGGIFGGQIGYNYQMGNLVLGAEVSLSGSPGGSQACPISNRFTCTADLDYLLIVGPRIGFAWDRWLAYGSGGYAHGKLKTGAESAAPGAEVPAGYNDSQDHDGWAIGGGLEYMITPNIVLGAEYMHVELDSERYAGSNTTVGVTRDVDASLDIVRARLSYKFGNDYQSLKQPSASKFDRFDQEPGGDARLFCCAGGLSSTGSVWAHGDRRRLKAEYLHFDLEDTAVNAIDRGGRYRDFIFDNTLDTGKIALNYKFGGDYQSLR